MGTLIDTHFEGSDYRVHHLVVSQPFGKGTIYQLGQGLGIIRINYRYIPPCPNWYIVPFGNGSGGYHVMLDNYYIGEIIHYLGLGWTSCLGTSVLMAEEIEYILEVVRGSRKV